MLAVLPSIFFWGFASIFLVPKIQQIWQEAGLSGSKAQWLINLSDAFHHHFYFVAGGIILLLFLVERWWPRWPLYRRMVVTIAIVLFHTLVLFGITVLATCALLAVPIILKHH
ncbi:MAG: hypothetical protein QM796_17540 [Chthoniobacteraceae bacterium]